MPRARGARQRAAVTLSPETGVRFSLTQIGILIGFVFFVAVGYAFIVWGQSATSKDVAEIKTTQIKDIAEIKAAQTSALAQVQVVARDQEEKRTALGRQFIESNEKIADSIGKLTTLTAVQQERQKVTDEKLEKVLVQIGSALSKTK